MGPGSVCPDFASKIRSQVTNRGKEKLHGSLLERRAERKEKAEMGAGEGKAQPKVREACLQAGDPASRSFRGLACRAAPALKPPGPLHVVARGVSPHSVLAFSLIASLAPDSTKPRT